MDGRSETGSSSFVPKKADGLVTRATEGPRTIGLEEAWGVNVLAAGLGLNSEALTLSLVDVADVGV